MRALLKYPESLVIVAYFALRPVWLLLWAEPSTRNIIIYGVVAPLIGALLATTHRRARFASYVFLTMELLRSYRAESLTMGAVAIGVLLVLQLPRMRALWPSVDSRRVIARWTGRA